jgi:hypothetical protein
MFGGKLNKKQERRSPIKWGEHDDGNLTKNRNEDLQLSRANMMMET